MPTPLQDLPGLSADEALQADKADPLAGFRDRFHFPEAGGREAIYFCGNSLGLQPKSVAPAMQAELEAWKNLAIEGYFRGELPWLYFQDYPAKKLAPLVGAREAEVTVMNALTVNLHLLMQSFYRPSSKRCKILMEAGAFPSDQYLAETVARLHGYDPDEAIIEAKPRDGEKTLRTEDICGLIEANAPEIAVVLLGGIHYYTGQLLDIKTITAATHRAGAIAGWDLAHAAGNVPLQLHDWNVDFAAWCSYKYLNAGPGAAGGVFVHERHGSENSTPRLGGWWGNEEKTRFRMEKGFVPRKGAGGWNVSTAQVFNMVALNSSLDLFTEAGIQAIREKSIRLTAWLEKLLKSLPLACEVITPSDPSHRGAQLSLYFPDAGRKVHEQLNAAGIICDYREPGVIRLAPAPLYCSFTDVFRVYETLKELK